MPGQLWKANVQSLNNQFDRCREQIDRLVAMEESNRKRYQVYNNGNTMVEVSIKTRKHSGNGNLKWDTILSQEDSAATEDAFVRRKTVKHKVSPRRTKSFAQPTKASKLKSRVKQSEDLKDDDVKMITHDRAVGAFPQRTLQIFLSEMRSALSHEASGAKTCHKILDDLEYVAGNLVVGSNPVVKGDEREGGVKIIHQEQLIEKLKSESESHKQEVKTLINELSKVKRQFSAYEDEVKVKDQKLAEYKAMVSRLTTNNNDMLALLTSKVPLEESLQKALSNNDALRKDLARERQRRRELEGKFNSIQKENCHLDGVISKLKQSLNFNVEDFKIACEEAVAAIGSRKSSPVTLNNDTTIDLCISSDHTEEAPEVPLDKTEKSESEEEDSAIGNSESLAVATDAVPQQKPSTSAVLSTSSKAESSVGRVSLGQQIVELQQKSREIEERRAKQEVFEAASLNLSETVNSGFSDTSQASLVQPPPSYAASVSHNHNFQSKNDEIRNSILAQVQELDKKQCKEEKRKVLLDEATGKVDAKVQEFLHRMKNDKRFQISLSSDQFGTARGKAGASEGSTVAHSTVNLDFTSDDSTMLTESKFRQGLEATLDISGTDND